MTQFNAEAIAQFLARNIMALNADAITWDEFGRRKRAAWDLVAQGEANIAGTDCERRHMQVQEHLDRIMKDRNPLGVEANTFGVSASNQRG